MHGYTRPREIAARWVREGDEVATYVEKGRREVARSLNFVEMHPGKIRWVAVLASPVLASGTSLKQMAAVADDVKKAATAIGLPIQGPEVAPVVVWGTDREQLVIRELVEQR